MRPRLAPIAARRASSRARTPPRASSRLVTFPQAISSTSATAPSSTNSRCAVIADHLLVQRLQHAGIDVQVTRQQRAHLLVDGPQLRAGLGLRHPLGEAADDGQIMIVVRRQLRRGDRERRPQLLAVDGHVERRRHDADDRDRDRVQRNRASNHVGVGGIAAGPQAVAQHHDPIVTRSVLLDCEHAADLRLHAESIEPGSGDAAAIDTLRPFVVRQVEAEGLQRAERGERGGMLAPVVEIADRDARGASAARRPRPRP